MLALSAGACAGEPLKARDADEWLLSGAEITREADRTREPGAVRQALEFVQAIQFRNYAAAWDRLSDDLRYELGYGLFSAAMQNSESGFRSKPVVESVTYDRGFAFVRMRLQFGRVRTPEDPQVITFAMRREGGRWVVAEDEQQPLTGVGGPFDRFREGVGRQPTPAPPPYGAPADEVAP